MKRTIYKINRCCVIQLDALSETIEYAHNIKIYSSYEQIKNTPILIPHKGPRPEILLRGENNKIGIDHGLAHLVFHRAKSKFPTLTFVKIAQESINPLTLA